MKAWAMVRHIHAHCVYCLPSLRTLLRLTHLILTIVFRVNIIVISPGQIRAVTMYAV